MIEILNRYTKAVLYTSATADTIAAAVLETRTRGADLSGADLRGADLSGADLRGAYPVSYTHLDVYKRQHT